jgi:hypothetical protein
MPINLAVVRHTITREVQLQSRFTQLYLYIHAHDDPQGLTAEVDLPSVIQKHIETPEVQPQSQFAHMSQEHDCYRGSSAERMYPAVCRIR